MGDVACIDISHWQGFPDFEKVAADGVLAVILKATEGTSYVDPNRKTNYAAATKAGLACCCYFWLKPGASAREQAEFFLATVDPIEGERVVIDYEEEGCTLQGLREAVQALLDCDRNLQIAVYSGHLLKQQLGDSCDEFLRDNTSLWLAHYTTGAPSWPAGTWPQWSLWQFTDEGSVAGIEGNCDCNRFNGSDDALLDWIGPAGEEELVEPLTVTIEIDVPPGVAVKVVERRR